MNSSPALQARPIKVVATLRNGQLAVENFPTIADAYAACDKYEAGGHEATMPDYSQSSAGAP